MNVTNSLSSKKNNYYKKIFTYLKRREKYRLKLNIAKKEYSNSVVQINKKIKLWKREMRRIDERYEKIKRLEQAVYIFTGVNIRSSKYSSEQNERVELARGFYYKYGLEHKMQAKELREVVGFRRIQQPTEYRKKITQLIVSNPEIRQKWETFKEYVKKP